MKSSSSNNSNLDAYWMPFTSNRRFKAAPRMLVQAAGMYYQSEDGNPILDGTAGLWCVNAGHGRKEIASAVAAQLESLDYAPTFQLGHPLAFRFAEGLAEIAPPGLDRIFFTGSGSDAVDTALKIALAYQRAIGQGTRTRFRYSRIALRRGFLVRANGDTVVLSPPLIIDRDQIDRLTQTLFDVLRKTT